MHKVYMLIVDIQMLSNYNAIHATLRNRKLLLLLTILTVCGDTCKSSAWKLDCVLCGIRSFRTPFVMNTHIVNLHWVQLRC